jgi:hypothetical protein
LASERARQTEVQIGDHLVGDCDPKRVQFGVHILVHGFLVFATPMSTSTHPAI